MESFYKSQPRTKSQICCVLAISESSRPYRQLPSWTALQAFSRWQELWSPISHRCCQSLRLSDRSAPAGWTWRHATASCDSGFTASCQNKVPHRHALPLAPAPWKKPVHTQRYPELSLASHWLRGGLCQWTDSDSRRKIEIKENTEVSKCSLWATQTQICEYFTWPDKRFLLPSLVLIM